jgi:hypothetical protein
MSEELARKYEPVIRYAKKENFYPMSVDPYLAKCSLHHKDEKMGVDGLVLPPELVTEEELQVFSSPDFYMIYAAQQVPDEEELARLKKWAEDYKATRGPLDELTKMATKLGIKLQRVFLPLDLPKEVQEQALENYGGYEANKPAYYYRFSEAGGYQILQYWFFFAYNDFATAHKGVNDHEADWEQITLFLKEGKPEWAAYASHDAKGEELRKSWDKIETVDTHPVVYAAVGSHASYFGKGEHHGIDNAPGDGLTVGEGGTPWETPGDLNKAIWATDYQGLWGYYAHERVSDKLLHGAVSPAGPKYNKDDTIRKAWENPLGWAELDE